MVAPRTAILILGFVTMLWGAQHSIMAAALRGTDSLEATVLNLLRFWLATACFSPWLPHLPLGKSAPISLEWRAGSELGLWLFLGFCLQAVGLLYTSAQRSCLILYLNVKLVPLFARFLFGREVTLAVWISAAAAFIGTLLVASDGTAAVPANVGDGLSLAAAAASALFILRLEKYAPATDSKALNAVTMLVVAVLCLPAALAQAALLQQDVVPQPTAFSKVCRRALGLLQHHRASLFYLGIVTTAFTNWLQTIGQRSISATTAATVYALDPLWGCLFAYLFLGEKLGWQGFCGCTVLLGVWAMQLCAASMGSDGTLGVSPRAAPPRTSWLRRSSKHGVTALRETAVVCSGKGV